MLDPLSTTVAGRLAGALAGPLVEPKDGVLGTAEQRAIKKACRDAVKEVVETFSENLNDSELVLVLTILDDTLERLPGGALPLVEGHGDDTAVEAWRDAFIDGGGDVATLPIAFGPFVEALLVVLPRKLREEAARHGSPLFEQIAVADLERLRHDAAAVRAATVPLAAELEHALDRSYAACRATDTPYFTPHLLLALLSLADRIVLDCFDRTQPGLGTEVREQLTRYVAGVAARERTGYAAFRWIEREDIRRAQILAAEFGSPVVTAPLLLAGVLDAPSTTTRQLRARLGAERFDQLRANALAARDLRMPAGTPGTVFDEVS